MSIVDTLLAEHPVRKTGRQKEAFRGWMVQQATQMGYAAQVEANGRNRNVVIGDPETAQVTFTAHYDTPPVMPWPNIVLPKNVPAFVGYQALSVLLVLALAAALGGLAGWLAGSAEVGKSVFRIVLIGEALLMLLGPANRNNANDNTSGMAAVMEIMARLPAQQRDKAAFILFDNEEKGLLGSGAYARKHKAVRDGKLVINLDCVGDGGHILFFANKATRALPVFPALCAAMEAQSGRRFTMNELEKSMYPSDQKHFRFGVAVCACRMSERFGYFCDKIHTAKDTVCEQANLDFIADGLVQFVEGLTT